MKLTGRQIGDLTEIICEAFTREDLAFFLRTDLNFQLDNAVSSREALRSACFTLIDKFDKEERAIELIRLLRTARPNVVRVQRFCDPLLAQEKGASAPPRTNDALCNAVESFNEGFQERIELFRYLNAYKELHDVLHELQNFHLNIAAAVADRKDASQPLPDDIAFFLEDHVRVARENAKDIEFPDKPPAWIARLTTAAEVINGPDVDKMPRQVERLRTLPAEGLGPLNDKLFENARRLQAKQLIGSLDAILAALGSGADPATSKIRGEVEEFRALCSELDEWINAHNLCQKIDDALREAAGLPTITATELSDWGVARQSLDDLAAKRKDDKRVQRTHEAAKLFEAANQARAFTTFLERFNDLFTETDKALLKVTNKLPRKAMALHAVLGEFK